MKNYQLVRELRENPLASGQMDKQEIIAQPPLAELQANEERQGNLLQEYEQRFEKLSEKTRSYPDYAPKQV